MICMVPRTIYAKLLHSWRGDVVVGVSCRGWTRPMIEVHTLTHLNMLQYTLGVYRGYRTRTRTIFQPLVGRAERLYCVRLRFCTLGAQCT